MSDVFDKETRSAIMSKVRSKGNKSTELQLMKLFKENGITGWRRNYSVEGKPDFVFVKQRIAVFVDGCFWHGHDCRNTRPSDNAEYWQKKRERNMKRDAEVTALFEKRGWRVLRIWECELKKSNVAATMERVRNALVYNKETKNVIDCYNSRNEISAVEEIIGDVVDDLSEELEKIFTDIKAE